MKIHVILTLHRTVSELFWFYKSYPNQDPLPSSLSATRHHFLVLAPLLTVKTFTASIIIPFVASFSTVRVSFHLNEAHMPGLSKCLKVAMTSDMVKAQFSIQKKLLASD